MQKILIPYDGSESAKRALQFVLDLPTPSRPAEIHLLNVQEWPAVYGEYVTADVIDLLRDGAMRTGRGIVDAAAGLAAASGIPCHTHVMMGDVGTIVAQQVEQLGCDHVVMGTRGMGALKGLLVGSVATKVLHHVKTPVTLVR